MKILILANKDLASNFAINCLLPDLKDHKICLFLSAKVGGIKKANGLKALKFFEQDLFTQVISPNLTPPNARESDCMSFEQMDAVLCQPHIDLNDINNQDSINNIQKMAPDLIISIRYGVILKKPIIAIPKHGVINLHSGLLPNYRGVMATFWALLNGEKTIGTTLHYIDDASIDTGSVIDQTELTVDPSRSYLWHVLSLYKSGSLTIIEAVIKITNKQNIKHTNQTGTGHYYTFPNELDLQNYMNKGLILIDENEYLNFIKSHYLN